MSIRFGTDGWRDVIACGFTFANLRRVVQAVCDHAAARRVVVGYDNRFLSRRFAEEACSVLLGNGVEVILGERPVPTPAVSCQVVQTAADLGLVLTASHNTPEFHGLKIKTAAGASAADAFTAGVEAQMDRNPPRQLSPAEGISLGTLQIRSFHRAHAERMSAVVDLPRVQSGRLRAVVDSMHGTGGRLIEELLAGSSSEAVTLRWERDPLFGGGAPEPSRPHLGLLQAEVRARGASLGLATDGDGDRLAAVDDGGAFVSPLRLAAVLALHLIRRRRLPGGIAKTFANTLYLDRIAAAEGRAFHCLPVGFKHVAALLERGELVLGGEESGGLGFARYLPERDGVLAGLLLLEAVAMAGKPLSALLRDLDREFGEYHYDRSDLPDPDGRLREAVARLSGSPPGSVAGLPVEGVDRLDGLKLLLGEAGWVMLRRSGTEPVLRIYAEATSAARVQDLLREAGRLLAGR